jgi:uncharacterized protein YjiS (DUF1127 family)
MCSRCRWNRSKNDRNVAPQHYDRNHIVRAGDGPVTRGHHSLRTDLRGIACCRNANPVHCNHWPPTIEHWPLAIERLAQPHYAGFGAEHAVVCSCARPVGDRGELHELGSSSRRESGGKDPSSTNILWEPPMLNSPRSVNRRYNLQSHDLYPDVRDDGGTTHEYPAQTPRPDLAEMSSRPSAAPTMARADRQNTAPGSSMFAFFIEGFALYGASLHAIATSLAESSSRQAKVEKLSPRERCRSLTIVASSTSPKLTATELENDTNRAGPGSKAPFEDAVLAQSYSSPSFTARSNYRSWLTRPWSTVRSRWARWRREREIKKVVAALVELDDRTLRDIGIPHRSQIERLVRYCFDC